MGYALVTITGDNRMQTMKSSAYKFCVQGRAIAYASLAFELNIDESEEFVWARTDSIFWNLLLETQQKRMD